MWTSSIPTALMAILLLSDPASARRRKRAAECDAPVPAITDTVASGVATPTEAARENGAGNEGPAPITVTVVPMPVGTVDGVFYPGVETGSGAAYPTGHHHKNHTHNETSTIPVFTLQNTDSITLPTPEPTPTELPQNRYPQGQSSISVAAPVPATTEQAPAAASTSQPPAQSSGPSSAPSSGQTGFLRGVNLGGWLVLEKWMNNDAFSGAFASATDQHSFDAMPGAQEALQKHWDTFFTEADIQKIASTGINALRIPIGYWAYDNDNTPYIKGADAYLEKAIGWARAANMKVWVDCHGSPGSQNGFDNSGQAGTAQWQTGDNMQRSISVLTTMAKKYAAREFADVVVGLQLTNEPISWGGNDFSKTQAWAQDAYKAVKAAAVANPDLVIVMHDAFQGATAWTDIGRNLIAGGSRTFGMDTHLYQLFTDSDNKLTQAQHITEACGWGAQLAAANAVMPTFIGEWSAATNICVNPDGSTTAGTSCSAAGCQCQSADPAQWNGRMVEQVRRYVEAQLDTFEQNASGYFIWSAKGPGGWGFLNGIANGAIPNPVTERKYPGQCGGGKRRARRGVLGVEAEAF